MTIEARACERAARDDGLAAGLALALAGFDVAATAPGRYAAIPAKQVPDDVPAVGHSLAAREDVVFLDCRAARAAGPAPVPDPARLAKLGRLLAAVRLGLTRRLLDEAVRHLAERTGGGEPLIRKQMVTGTVADVIAAVELLRAYAVDLPDGAAPDPSVVADAHARVTDLDWQVIGLFGAAGYIADHPARALYVSALVANTWIPEGASR